MEQGENKLDLHSVVQDILGIYEGKGERPAIKVVIGGQEIKTVWELVNMIYEILYKENKLPDTLKLTSKKIPVPKDRRESILQKYLDTNIGRGVAVVKFETWKDLSQALAPGWERSKNWETVQRVEVNIGKIRKLLEGKWNENKSQIKEIFEIKMIHKWYRVLLRCLLDIKCTKDNEDVLANNLQSLFNCLQNRAKSNCLQEEFSLWGRKISLEDLGIVVLKLVGVDFEDLYQLKLDQQEVNEIIQKLSEIGFGLNR